MKRVLVLSDLWVPFPGGAERLIFNIARHLQQRGHKVAVVTGYEHARCFDGPPVVIDLDLPVDAQGAAAMWEHIQAFEPDVILTHHVYARGFESLLALWGRPVVQVVLNGPRLESAAHAVFISGWVRREAGNARADDTTMTPPAFGDVVADSHGDAIGFIKPIAHKGAEFFWRIVRQLPERKFVVLRGEWQDLEIIEHHRNVELMEPVEDMRDFWRRVRLVLVPSLSEDAGTVGQEAAANGVPCISSKAGGLPETNGGILLSTTRVTRWCRAIKDLDDPYRYAQVVERQRAHLAAADHAGALDALAERIAAL